MACPSVDALSMAVVSWEVVPKMGPSRLVRRHLQQPVVVVACGWSVVSLDS